MLGNKPNEFASTDSVPSIACPVGLTTPASGLKRSRAALKHSGILAIWSASGDPSFSRRLEQAGFDVEETKVRARENGKGPTHTIWFARRT